MAPCRPQKCSLEWEQTTRYPWGKALHAAYPDGYFLAGYLPPGDGWWSVTAPYYFFIRAWVHFVMYWSTEPPLEWHIWNKSLWDVTLKQKAGPIKCVCIPLPDGSSSGSEESRHCQHTSMSALEQVSKAAVSCSSAVMFHSVGFYFGPDFDLCSLPFWQESIFIKTFLYGLWATQSFAWKVRIPVQQKVKN